MSKIEDQENTKNPQNIARNQKKKNKIDQKA